MIIDHIKIKITKKYDDNLSLLVLTKIETVKYEAKIAIMAEAKFGLPRVEIIGL